MMKQMKENLKKIDDSKISDKKITLNQKGSGIFSFLLPMLASTIIPSLINTSSPIMMTKVPSHQKIMILVGLE